MSSEDMMLPESSSSLCHSKAFPGWSFSVARSIRHSKVHPLWSLSLLASCQHQCLGREATVMALPSAHASVVAPASMAAWLSSRGIACHRIPRLAPSGHLPVVNSIPQPWTALQSICSSSHLLCIPVDLGPSLGYIGLQHGLSLWISHCHSDCHRSAASFSNGVKCFPSVQPCCPYMDISLLLQLAHPLSVGPVLLTPSFPLPSFILWVLHGSVYSFPVIMDSCQLSAGALWHLLHPKMYSWCIHRERCTPHLPFRLFPYSFSLQASKLGEHSSLLRNPCFYLLQQYFLFWLLLMKNNMYKS